MSVMIIEAPALGNIFRLMKNRLHYRPENMRLKLLDALVSIGNANIKAYNKRYAHLGEDVGMWTKEEIEEFCSNCFEKIDKRKAFSDLESLDYNMDEQRSAEDSNWLFVLLSEVGRTIFEEHDLKTANCC